MESSAVSLCKSVLDIVLGQAKAMVADEVAVQLGVQREVAIMADEFEMMRYFLMTIDNNVDREWLKQTRDLAYDVLDGLERFSAKVDQLEKPSRWRIPRILCERRRATLEVKALLARVAEVAFVSKKSLYSRLVKGSDDESASLAAAEQSDIFAAIAAVDEARRAAAAGLDESKVDLRHLIYDGMKDLRVIVVWGTSFHLDKISAVNEVYGDVGNENTKFGCRAWVRLACLSGQTEILRNLVNQLSAEVSGRNEDRSIMECGFAELEKLAMKFLSRERFLLVIDGLRSLADWEWIRTYFPDKKKGSRIIVSSQQLEIASLCTERSYQVSELTQLASEQTVYLFHYKAKPEPDDSTQPISDLGTTAIPDELIGMERQKRDLTMLICQDPGNHECMVIPVFGMGGIGKTTLVRSIYGSPQLAGFFENRAWVTVPHPFNLASICKSIAQQLYGLTGEDMDLVEPEDLFKEIAKLLDTTRCLIVLDDLNSTQEWDLIIHILERAAVIVVTTRDTNLARHCSKAEEYMYKITTLADDEALTLFKRKVFKRDEYISLSPEMMEEAHLIIKKCGGLPLAIATIGGFLSNRPKTQTEWRRLHDHISSELEINADLQTIRTVLIRSYNGLPYNLKSCFLYLAIFPEDYNIKRKRLIRLWVAEGYSTELQYATAEEVADKYFAELLDSSMIMPTTKVTYSTGKIYSCRLHDLIHEMCTSMSTEEEVVFTLEEGCSTNTKSKARQFAISEKWTRNKDEFHRMDLSHVRSLTVFGEWASFFISESMKFIRVLDLEDSSGLKDRHLKQICELLHLNYLSLRGCNDIFKMPESLGNLRQLHTLDIRGTNIFQLPSTFSNLRKLQHLHASAWFKDEHKVWSSASNEPATDNLKRHDKLNLCSGYINNFSLIGRPASRVVQVPRGIGKLNALRTLGYVRMAHGKGNASVKELKELTQLRKLELLGIDRTNSRGFWSAIADHEHLRSLSVNRDCVADGVDRYLDVGLSPPKFLENLKLWGRLVRLMEWVQQLQYLSKLQLHSSGLNQDGIEAIGKLPNLVILRVWKYSFLEKELKFRKESFPSLILLELRELYDLTSVKFEEGGMPKLQLLQATGWSGLHEFLCLGVLVSLKEIQIGSELSDELKENVRRQQAVHPNYFNLKLKSDQSTLVRDLE